MSEATTTNVENRLNELEERVQEILDRIGLPQTGSGPRPNWQQSLGMFDGRPVMQEIDEAGQRVRLEDRSQAADTP